MSYIISHTDKAYFESLVQTYRTSTTITMKNPGCFAFFDEHLFKVLTKNQGLQKKGKVNFPG